MLLRCLLVLPSKPRPSGCTLPTQPIIHRPRLLHVPQLWNFATSSRLFEFEGWGCAVRCIAPSPALDVVGVGLEDG